MSSDQYQDTGAHRIKRKPPPPFPYSARYPEPDPSDPFASLSVLRDRTATLTNSAYESPLAIPDSTPGSSKVHDLAAFITSQRKKSSAPRLPFGESRWLGHAPQLRKGASMGLGLHPFTDGEVPMIATISSTTPRPGTREVQRHESRRRSQSVFALRSGTFSFLESRAAPEPLPKVEPPSRRHSLSPCGSSASVLTSSSASSGDSMVRVRQAVATSSRPRSCSSFVSAVLLDGVPEHSGDVVPVHKNMHVMQVDMPATRGTEEHPENPQSRPPLSSLPLPLEKRTPSASSIDSWSRDLAFYSAPSRPQTPSSVRSSRPVSLPSSTALSSFPLAHINLPPAALAPFTTSPLTSPTHQTVPVSPPSGGSLPLPPSISISRRVSTPPEDLDALPLQLNFRFPKQERSVESEPESVDREAGRFARLRARTSSALQVRRSSASSSLRSKLQAAADAADRLASEDGSIAAPPPATAFPAATQGPVIVVESMAVLSSKKQAGGIPGSASKEQAVHQRTAGQLGDQVCGTESPAAHAPRGVHAFPLQNMDSVQPASHTQGAGNVRHVALRPEVKPEPEPEPALPPKKRSQSWGSHKAIGGRSTSTPLPLSRPLPSPPTVTTHPEPIIDSPPTPPPRAHGHGLTRGQNQYVPPAPSLTTHSVSPPTLHVAHVAPSTASHASLPAGAAAPSRVAHASTAPVVHTTHPLPPSQITHLSPSPPPPPPPPRTAQTATLPSRMGHASVSSVIQSTSSSSSHVDNMSTASAPQMRRRDASPSSSHGQHSPHTSERHGPYHHHPGHHHHPPHHHHGHPRSLSEPGPAGVLSSSQLAHAARLPVVRENGVRLQFGELWRTQRTVVIFIRHFWCPMCQDYLTSLMRDVDHVALLRSGVRLIVVGCGSYGLIRSYRQIFRLPYELFVDASPGQALYRTFGMSHVPSGTQKARSPSLPHGTRSYVRHGAVSGLAMVVAHALRVGMPVWERGGDATQLGGEFVLGPGMSCTYAHRMQTTTGHAPILDVLAAAGVRAVRRYTGISGLGAAGASTGGTVRPNISLPLERGSNTAPSGRDAKVLSVVREEACGACGACEGCAEALSIELESTASGEWSVVVTGNGRSIR